MCFVSLILYTHSETISFVDRAILSVYEAERIVESTPSQWLLAPPVYMTFRVTCTLSQWLLAPLVYTTFTVTFAKVNAIFPIHYFVRFVS